MQCQSTMLLMQCALRELMYIADPEYLAFVERLNAEPQADSRVEAPTPAARSQNRPVTALMAFLQEKHARKNSSKPGAAVTVRTRKGSSRARPVTIPLPNCMLAAMHMLLYTGWADQAAAAFNFCIKRGRDRQGAISRASRCMPACLPICGLMLILKVGYA